MTSWRAGSKQRLAGLELETWRMSPALLQQRQTVIERPSRRSLSVINLSATSGPFEAEACEASQSVSRVRPGQEMLDQGGSAPPGQFGEISAICFFPLSASGR